MGGEALFTIYSVSNFFILYSVVVNVAKQLILVQFCDSGKMIIRYDHKRKLYQFIIDSSELIKIDFL
jgi:hypothetical protein